MGLDTTTVEAGGMLLLPEAAVINSGQDIHVEVRIHDLDDDIYSDDSVS